MLASSAASVAAASPDQALPHRQNPDVQTPGGLGFPQAEQAVRITRTRTIKGKTSRGTAYLTISLPAGQELADLAQQTMDEAAAVLGNARRALGRVTGRARGRRHKAINELSTVVARAATVVAQGRKRVSGERIESATRLVSLHDPDARPIVKGKLGTPVEFGYKAQVVDNEDGLVLDYDVKTGNPPDAEQLAPAVRRIAKRLGRTPQKATADRGYGED